MTPELGRLVVSIFEALIPVGIEAVKKALQGDMDPLRGLLDDNVVDTLPSPLRSRIALDAAEARDAEKKA